VAGSRPSKGVNVLRVYVPVTDGEQSVRPDEAVSTKELRE
jgi:hypothetical protein